MKRGHAVRYLILLFLLTLTFVARPTGAQDSSPTDSSATRSGEAAKKSLGSTPWYDPEKDIVKPMEFRTPEVDEANRQSRWNPKPKAPVAAPPTTATTPGGGGMTMPTTTGSVDAGMFAYIMVGLIGVAILIVLTYVLVNRSTTAIVARTTDDEEELEAENIAAKLEQLPIRVSSGHKDLLSEALRLAKIGQLDQAIIYLFGHTLIQLDRRHRIRLAQGKTNRQYLREVGVGSELFAPTEDIVSTFESSYFGGHTPDQTRFDRCVQNFRVIDEFLIKLATTAALFVMLLIVPGCGEQLQSDYGQTKGPLASQSLNGFTAIRGMYREYGWQDRDDHTLNRRLKKAKALFCAPVNDTITTGIFRDVMNGTPSQSARMDWFEEWLRNEKQRTLVIVFPSYDATAEYMRDMISQAPPEMRLTYRRMYAKQVISEFHRNQSLTTAMPANTWFTLKALPLERSCLVHGPWVDSDLENAEFVAGVEIGPSEDRKDLQLTKLVSDEQDRGLVVKLTSDKWPGSQIILVAMPSFLVNYSLTKPESRALSDQLISACGTPGRIVFLDTSHNFRVVAEDDNRSRPSGLTFLSEWPLNIAAAHASLIGFVILLAIAPIFGRPKRIAVATRTDFGRHLTALGELLQRIGDKGYARRLISDYFVQVRSEPESQWVIAPTAVVDNANSNQTVANPAALRGPFFNLAAPNDPPATASEPPSVNTLAPPPSKPGESP